MNFPIGIQLTKLDTNRILNLKKHIDIINSLDEFWTRAKTEGGIQSARTSDIISLTAIKESKPVFKEIDDFVFSIFDESVKKYQRFYGINGLSDYGYDIIRYCEGQEYKPHCDQLLKYPGSERVVSGIIYVNDDYLGGEIEFTRLNFKIKPEAGTVLLFPSNFIYEHQSHVVSFGTKFAIVVFFRRTS
jgi:predicted 2-oxoglutarate/Fe(II)-dependent dioxygenase YbiX